MYELALFAGAGGGILGGILCGHTCIGAVEIEEFPRKVLLQRQRDGILPKFPIWDDVCTFRKANPKCRDFFKFLRSIRNELVISGGFPCQDISSAGKGTGIAGERSGLWKDYARIIHKIRPARVFVENSPILTSRGLGVVLGDLAKMGYNAKWGVLGAVDVKAPHKRERIWILATNSNMQSNDAKYGKSYKGPNKFDGDSQQRMGHEQLEKNYQMANANSTRCEGENLSQSKERDQGPIIIRTSEKVSDSKSLGCNTGRLSEREAQEITNSRKCSEDGNGKISNANQQRAQVQTKRKFTAIEVSRSNRKKRSANQEPQRWWATEPRLGRVAYGVDDGVDRLIAIGNGQVPAVVFLAWRMLS